MSKLREPNISNCEKKFVLTSLSEWMRLDGRAFEEFRKLKIEFGKDWGCCFVSLGNTSVLAQVSCEVQQPKSSRPSEGLLNINLELNPLGAPHFEAGRPSELSMQLNRLLEKCIKDSKAVDLESLCIKVNEKVWALRVDINVLNHEGNILDCASVATLAALAHFRRPDVTIDGENVIVHTYAEKDPIPTVIHHYPVCVSYNIFKNGEVILADPGLLEESVAEGQLIFGLNAYKELCGLHLGGISLMSVDIILKTTSKATEHAKRMIQQIKDVLESDLNARSKNEEVGFQNLFNTEVKVDSTELLACLDKWSVQNIKNKSKKKFEKKSESGSIGHVESFSKGSAVLMPTENDNKQGWCAISDEELEEEIILLDEEVSVKETNIVDSYSSEEEAVVVLNADKKTNKKKTF